VAIVVAAAIPLVAIVLAVTISSSTTSSHTRPHTAPAAFTPTGPSLPTSARPHRHRAAGFLVAILEHATELRRRPGGPGISRIGTRTPFGSPQVLSVVARRGTWLGVLSPLAGNGRIGWIPSTMAAFTHVSWELRASLSARLLTVLDGGRVLRRFKVAIGSPAAPTPTGRFAVTDRLLTRDQAGPYGCCVLALSAIAPHAIQGWSGGNRIAIHSTPETSTIGEAVSHGCLRLTTAEGRWLMGHIPLGTPTVISS
jgi:hypothetical protein